MEEHPKENKEIRIVSPGERLAEIIVDTLETHQRYMRRCHGIAEDIEVMNNDARVLIRVRAMVKVMHLQREMITNSRSVVYHKSKEQWLSKYRSPEEQASHPFEKEKNDYSKLMFLLKALKSFVNAVRTADETPSLDDDFLRTTTNGVGVEQDTLTDNYYDMVDDLEETYEQIYTIMLRNDLISKSVEQQDRRKKLNEIF